MEKKNDRKELAIKADKLYQSGKSAEAAELFFKVLDKFDKEDEVTEEHAQCYNATASALAESGQFSIAIKFFLISIQMYNELRNENAVATINFNLGNVFKYANNWQQSYNHYKLALDAFEKCNNDNGVIISLLGLGHLFGYLNVNDEMEQYLNRLWSFRHSFNKEQLYSFKMFLGKYAYLKKRYQKAMQLSKSALKIAQDMNNLSYISETESIIADLLSLLNKKSESLNHISNAYNISRDISDKSSIEHAFTMALHSAESGDIQTSIELFEECINQIDYRRLQFDGAERYLYMERYAEIARKYVKILSQQGDWLSAFIASEKVQARTILDLMFRHQIKRQAKRKIKVGPLGRLLLCPPTMDDIISFFSKENTYLFKLFFPDENSLLCWFLSPDGNIKGWDASETIPIFRKILDNLPFHHFLNKSPTYDSSDGSISLNHTHDSEKTSSIRKSWYEIKPLFNVLYNKLFPKSIKATLEKRKGKLAIIPHMDLFSFPFSALGRRVNDYLIFNWNITLVPSAGVALQLDVRRDLKLNDSNNKDDIDLLVVGDCGPEVVLMPIIPNSKKHSVLEFCGLPGAREEAIRIAQKFNTTPLIGEMANKANVLNKFPNSDVIHFATHGLWDPLFSNRSFLLLKEGVLSSDEIIHLNSKAELIVLAACQTGMGHVHPDSYIGLAQSFLISGARSLIVTLWPITDIGALEFMDIFYNNINKNYSISEAFRLTQISVLSQPMWSENMQWATYQPLGWPFYSIFKSLLDERLEGPAFCGGDILYKSKKEKYFPLEQFKHYVQEPNVGAFIVDGNIMDIPMSNFNRERK